ncbi:MAG TPA: LodA/GoxA family CTQ-dependent oxidase, partial [Steroidobacteraceae bacterium]
MSMLFKIHPAIGVARLGDSTSEFCITPESTGALPIECDHEGRTTLGPDGTEQRVSTFKDRSGAIKRQAARFRVYVSSAENNLPAHELTLGEIIEVTDKFSGRRIRGEVVDIHWTVYLANKKASFYEFHQLQGEYGYDADHPLRNADITGDGPRRRLIIDPGPQTVSGASDSARRAFFSRQENASVPQTFPPHLQPFSIDTLGALLVSQQNGQARLLVLGGHGRSGSMRTGFGEPKISSYANNDGWFDDTSDGPVTAQLEINVLEVNGHPPQPSVQHVMFPVQSAAWVVVAYPRYAPQITDVVTMDDTIFDTAVRNLAFRPEIFGVPPFDRNDPANRPASDEDLGRWRRAAQWNPAYYPRFWRDIWPILERPDRYKWVMDFDPFTGSDPHNPTPGAGGLFDPQYISQPPNDRQDPKAREASRQRRQAIYETLRGSGQENIYQLPRTQLRPHEGPIGMPDLCGDNPMTNIAASKFLRLSETTLFFMRQWVDGRFIDERAEGFDIPDRGSPPG